MAHQGTVSILRKVIDVALAQHFISISTIMLQPVFLEEFAPVEASAWGHFFRRGKKEEGMREEEE